MTVAYFKKDMLLAYCYFNVVWILFPNNKISTLIFLNVAFWCVVIAFVISVLYFSVWHSPPRVEFLVALLQGEDMGMLWLEGPQPRQKRAGIGLHWNKAIMKSNQAECTDHLYVFKNYRDDCGEEKAASSLTVKQWKNIHLNQEQYKNAHTHHY